MITVLFNVEGVLAETRSDNIVDNNPISEGMHLWRALSKTASVLMYSARPLDRVSYWLQREHVDVPIELYELESDVAALITKARFSNYDVDMLVSGDPDHVVAAYRSGVTGLLFAQPSYGRPEWSPDYDDSVRPWSSMVEEIVGKRLTLAKDGRTTAHE